MSAEVPAIMMTVMAPVRVAVNLPVEEPALVAVLAVAVIAVQVAALTESAVQVVQGPVLLLAAKTPVLQLALAHVQKPVLEMVVRMMPAPEGIVD